MGEVPVELVIQNLKTTIGNLSGENAMLSALISTKDFEIQRLREENEASKPREEAVPSPE